MKINIRERLKNKTFLVTMAGLAVAFVYQILALFGVVPGVGKETIVELFGIAINVLAMLGVIVDPTTEGISDSERALTYGTENDVRNAESEE